MVRLSPPVRIASKHIKYIMIQEPLRHDSKEVFSQFPAGCHAFAACQMSCFYRAK